MAFIFFYTALAVISTVRGTELVPERYLRPRDFNHHPFTDVGDGIAIKQQASLTDVHPYAILASKRPREGRQFPDQEEVLYPNPPAAVLPRKPAVQLHEEPTQYLASADPYNTIPKNYAFSYSVKDKHSGDDFSHSQAHNGKATRGQYRVKLPDGRIQVVSYTADHKGYRADVQYEGAGAGAGAGAGGHQAVTPVYEATTPAPDAYVHPAPQQYLHQSYSPTPAAYYQPAQQYIQTSYTATPSPYQEQQSYSPTPSPYQEQQSYSPTPSPYQQEQAYSPTPSPYQHEQAYSPTPSPYQQEQAYSPTPSPYQQEQSYSPTPSPYQQEESYSPTPAPYSQQHNYSPTPAPYHQEQQYPPTPPTYTGYASFARPTAYRQLVHYNSPNEVSYPTAAPQQNQQSYAAQGQNFASPSPVTFPTSAPAPQSYQPPSYASSSSGLQAYAAPASAANYEAPSLPEFDQSYVSPPPSAFAIQPHLRSSPAPFARHQYVTSTESPSLGHIIVTPRTQRNSNPSNGASRRIFGARQHVIYRLKSSS